MRLVDIATRLEEWDQPERLGEDTQPALEVHDALEEAQHRVEVVLYLIEEKYPPSDGDIE